MKKLNEIINILIRLVVNLSERCIYISLIFEPNKALYTVLSDLFLKLLRNLRSLRRKDICKCKLPLERRKRVASVECVSARKY